MEVGGLVVGVAGLAALFSSCIQCIDYVTPRRTFGADFETCLLRLDTAKLHLSRWGSSVGLVDAADGTQTSPNINSSTLRLTCNEYDIARRFLEHVRGELDEAEQLSKEYTRSRKKSAGKRQANSTTNEAPGITLSTKAWRLHESLNQLDVGRQKRTSLIRKTGWAIYDKNNFERLIASIHNSVTSLTELFPYTVEQQIKQMCHDEAVTLDLEDRQLLARTCDEDDALLSEALIDQRHAGGEADTLEATSAPSTLSDLSGINPVQEAFDQGRLCEGWVISDHARVHVGGRNVARAPTSRHTATNFVISGSADIWIGHDNRGR